MSCKLIIDHDRVWMGDNAHVSEWGVGMFVLMSECVCMP